MSTGRFQIGFSTLLGSHLGLDHSTPHALIGRTLNPRRSAERYLFIRQANWINTLRSLSILINRCAPIISRLYYLPWRRRRCIRSIETLWKPLEGVVGVLPTHDVSEVSSAEVFRQTSPRRLTLISNPFMIDGRAWLIALSLIGPQARASFSSQRREHRSKINFRRRSCFSAQCIGGENLNEPSIRQNWGPPPI